MNHGKQKTYPLSKCSNKCSLAGSCIAWNDQPNPQPNCLCHRGFDVRGGRGASGAGVPMMLGLPLRRGRY